jgi:hypothetical protein
MAQRPPVHPTQSFYKMAERWKIADKILKMVDKVIKWLGTIAKW